MLARWTSSHMLTEKPVLVYASSGCARVLRSQHGLARAASGCAPAGLGWLLGGSPKPLAAGLGDALVAGEGSEMVSSSRSSRFCSRLASGSS